MLDIPYNGQILNEQVVDRDPADHLDELPEWNRKIAEQAAAEEGIEMTEEHWKVVHYLRRRFATHGQARYARELSRELEQEIAGRRGSRFLFGLFPGGPVSQGCRIAGIPAPPYHEDRSFGSVQ
jgi:tRNA 2-thiouridine synthesizing protein E